MPAPFASTSGTTPRMKAKQVIRIGRSAGLHCGLVPRLAGIPKLLSEFHDQNRVFRRQTNEHNQFDLHNRVETQVL